MMEWFNEIERYATEMVDEGCLTRENVEDERKAANLYANEWVTRYKHLISESSVDTMHDLLFCKHFAKNVRDTRIKAAQIKLDSPDWLDKVKPSLNTDGTVTLTVDKAIHILQDVEKYCDDQINEKLGFGIPYSRDW